MHDSLLKVEIKNGYDIGHIASIPNKKYQIMANF